MRHHTKVLMTALAAALVLSAAVGSATARRLELSSQLIRFSYSTDLLQAPIEWHCPVTLEGSFHSRTLSKVSGQLVGLISRAVLQLEGCVFGESTTEVRFLTASLPWHIRYNSFKGTLPLITEIRLQIIGLAWLLTAVGTSCLYRTTAARPLFGSLERETGGVVTAFRVDETTTIPLFEGNSLICPSTHPLEGVANVFQLNTTTRITIRLVP